LYSNEDNSRGEAASHLKEKAYSGTRKKGRVGGVWDAVPAPVATPPAPTRSHSQRQETFSDDRYRSREQEYASGNGPNTFIPDSSVRSTGQTSGAASDGSYERGIISTLCTPGGMRAVPPKDKLDGFLKSALTLDPDVVGPILEECLTNEAWQVDDSVFYLSRAKIFIFF